MRTLARVTQTLHTVGIIFIMIMAVLITLQIIFRILGIGIGGVEELTGYMVLWLCFLELPNITHREITVRVDLIIMHLRPAAQKALRVITNTVCMCILLLLAYKGLQIVHLSYEVNRMTTYLRIPLYILQAILPLGVTVTFFELLFSTASIIRKKDVASEQIGNPIH